MTSEYLEFQEAAEDLLTELGQSISVARVASSAYSTSTLTTATNTSTSYSGVGWPTNYIKNEIDGETVLASDIKLWFYASTLPLVNDVFTVDTIAYRAITVRQYTVQGQRVLFLVQLRV